MKINKENIDEYMFRLLENDLNPKETEALKQVIAENHEYQKLWQNWKNTVVTPENLMPYADFSHLKKESKKGVILWWHYAAAASIIIVLGLGILMNQTKQNNQPILVGNKKPVITVPEIKPINQNTVASDSSKDFKEKVRHYAKSTINPTPKDQIIDIETPNENNTIDNKIAIEIPVNNEIKKESPLVFEKTNPVLVSTNPISVEYYQEAYIGGDIENKPKTNIFKRMFSKPSLKIVNDTTTKLNKKLIIENDKYKIFAGF